MLKPLLFIALWGFPGLLHGQSTVDIRVTANVMDSIELITIETIDFQNTGRTDAAILVNPLQSSNAGKMIARGNPGSEFRMNYLQIRELTHQEGNGTILFTYQVAGSNIDDQATAELLGQEIRALEFNDDGEFYIWIGGHVNLLEAEPGSYQGDFTIEFEYI